MQQLRGGGAAGRFGEAAKRVFFRQLLVVGLVELRPFGGGRADGAFEFKAVEGEALVVTNGFQRPLQLLHQVINFGVAVAKPADVQIAAQAKPPGAILHHQFAKEGLLQPLDEPLGFLAVPAVLAVEVKIPCCVLPASGIPAKVEFVFPVKMCVVFPIRQLSRRINSKVNQVPEPVAGVVIRNEFMTGFVAVAVPSSP